MKTKSNIITHTSIPFALFVLFGFLLVNSGCTKKDSASAIAAASYKQVNLVADTAGSGSGRIDITSSLMPGVLP